MKYFQPYGISDPDAPYINGNPSTGTMGSIPPAESIEHPQREISNFINKSALTPTAADLFQLSKAVQSGFVNWGLDGGEPNKIYITPVVPIGAYHVGQRFVIKVSYGSTSQVTVNVSGLGQVPLIHTDQTPLQAYELLAGQLIEVAYDGVHFQLMAGGAPGGVVTLTATRDIYVNDAIGSDTLYDGTSPAIIGVMGGPFKTIQKALATMTKYNLGGWAFVIHLADGVYANTSQIDCPLPNGSGTVYLRGNASNPQAVSIFNTNKGTALFFRSGGNYNIDGLCMRTTAGMPGDPGCGVWAGGASNVVFGACAWASCTGYHILVGGGGTGFVGGDQTIIGPAAAHHAVFANGVLYNNTTGTPANDPALNITAAVTMPSGFVNAADGGQLRPLWGKGITGAANVTGPKYSASGNGVIQTGGQGASYLPGSTAGITSSGGQYL